jgi:hypothetical protein
VFLAGRFAGRSNVETTLDYFRPVGSDSYWDTHREEVKDVFVTSWDAYAKYAWGKLIDLLLVVVYNRTIFLPSARISILFCKSVASPH